MKQQQVIDHSIPKTNEKKYFYFVLIAALINGTLWFVAGMTNKNYPLRGAGQSLIGKFLILYLGIIFFGFILGLLVSLISFKGLSFGRKYIRSSLLSILALSVVLLIFIIRSIVMFS